MLKNIIIFCQILCIYSIVALADTTYISLTHKSDSKTYNFSSNDVGPLIIETTNCVEGCMISVKIIDGYINNDENESLLILEGHGDTTISDGLRISYKFETQPKFLFNTNIIYAWLDIKKVDSLSSATVIFTRLGEPITTTTESATTDNDIPTTDRTVESQLLVYVAGKTDVEYLDESVQNAFKEAVINMAIAYCNSENIVYEKNITMKNVQLHNLIRCPYNWPDYETCVQILFSVPVMTTNESNWDGYQLTKQHLQIMWDRYADTYLEEKGIQKYTELDTDSVFIYWISAVVLITLLFGGIVLFISRSSCFSFADIKNTLRMSRSSDTDMIITDMDDMEPHYLQVIPPIFEKYSDLKNNVGPNNTLSVQYMDEDDLNELFSDSTS